MDIRELKYFLAVAKEENLSRAAEYLYITQPSLTRQMQNLESEIGRPLFIRGGRKMTLTETGLQLQKRAQEIVDLYDKTRADLVMPEKISGEVNIGGGESYAVEQIANVIKELQETYPDIVFNIYSGNTNDVAEKIDKGLLDFGILIEPFDLSKYDYLPFSSVDTWGVLMRKDSKLAEKEFIVAQDLMDKPLICSLHAMSQKQIFEWFGCGKEKLDIIATYNLLYNASLLVKAGVGYAVCLDKIVYTGEDSELCFRPLYPKLESKLNIVWKKYQIFSNQAQVFLKKIQETFSNALSL